MARLREVSFVVRKVGPWGFAKKLVHEVNEDGVMNMAAAVAFYWLLALFPFFIFLLTVLPLLPQRVQDRTMWHVYDWTYSNLAPQAADTVSSNFKALLEQPRAGLLSFGLLATLWAASNGMNATMAALDKCYDVNRPRPFWMQRLVSMVITVCVVVAILLVTALVPIGSLLLKLFQSERWLGYVPSWASNATALWLINLGRYSLGVFLVILIVSSIYQFGVSVRRRWTLITPGAVFAVLGVIVSGYGFNWYIQHFGGASYAKTYGALGGVIILLLLFYFYAVVFLIGAEINSEIDYEILGHHHDETPDALPKLYGKDDLAKFRQQLLKRKAGRF